MSRAEQDALSRTALGVFRLNGQFLAVSEKLAEPAGLTAAWWQVLGAVLPEPLPVAGIARTMGITRQSVQRIADLLVREGLASYEPNPAHRRAKLLAPSEAGRAAIARIDPGHAELAAALVRELGGQDAFDETVRALDRLSAALEAVEACHQ
ncbi:MarR family winged helix-turn-helix transcriptional regulator [Streptomyces sp. NPDC001919]